MKNLLCKTYYQADHLLRLSRNRDHLKVNNNTTLRRNQDGTIALCLHLTDIVTYNPNGEFVIRTGGWHTSTTRKRLNDYTPGRFFIADGKLRLSWAGCYVDQFEREVVESLRLGADGVPVDRFGDSLAAGEIVLT